MSTVSSGQGVASVVQGIQNSTQGVTIATAKNELESISPDSALWVQNWEAKKWSDVDVNGVSLDPVLISLPNGKVHAFAVGADLYLSHKWYSQSTGWSSWVSTTRKSASSPVVTHYGTATANTFAVFYVSLEHIPYGGISTSDTDFTWTAIGDGVKKLRSDSLAALDRSYDQSMSVVGVELTTGELLHTWSAGGTWANAWETRSGAGYCLSKPTIVCSKALCIDVFVFAADRGLRQLTHRSGGIGWGTWQNLSGAYIYDPISISASPGRIDVFGIGLDGYIYRSTVTLTGNEVGSFTRTYVGAPSISSPKVQVTSPGVFSVTTRKSKGVYQQIFYESTTGVWTPSSGIMMGNKLFYAELGAEVSSVAKIFEGGIVAV
ncbi:uncharacterized protein Bfra_004212 [Botrytis fragariae]|uniref:PLL-like beta propeller domain-containing protein n=1 Tax=Botrytis fragariae TaxID=1964551 RepID=A0A8H6AV86_9HELO|nr:uncharacterized protein Bfra_004212 [Botrytis fragariae]KAF5874206.1 hypothetical protein Bfra_004212 [Botrytis fragariae]